MEFDKIKNPNINNINPSFKKPEPKEEILYENDSGQTLSKTPSDPKFWQALSFKGNKNPDKTKSDNEDKILETLKGISSGIFSKESKSRYFALLESAKENLSFDEINPMQIFYFGDVLKLIAQNPEAYDENKAFLDEIYSSDKIDSKTKILFLSRIMPRTIWSSDKPANINKFQDEIRCYSILIPAFNGENAGFEALSALNPSKETLETASGLLDDNTITPDDFTYLMLSASKSPIKGARESFESVLNQIQKDSNKLPLMRLLLPYRVFNNDISIQLTDEILKENSSAKRKILEYLSEAVHKNSDGKYGYPLWHNTNEVREFLNSVSEDNVDDVISLIETTKGMPFEGVAFCPLYVNPKSGHFDKNVFSIAQKLEQQDSIHFSLTGYYAPSAAKACVDENTGEISPIAMKFLDNYYFQENEKSPASKLKLLKRKALSKNMNARMYYQTTNLSSGLTDILNALKDNSGSFNKTNYKYISKIMESDIKEWSYFGFLNEEFFTLLKDENGIIQKDKFNFAFSAAKKTESFMRACEFLKAVKDFPPSKLSCAIEQIKTVYTDEFYVYNNFPVLCGFCFDKKGDIIQNEFDFISKLNSLHDSAPSYRDYTKEFLEFCKNDNNKKFVLDVASASRRAKNEITDMDDIFEKYKNEKGEIDPFIQNKILKYVSCKAPLRAFPLCFELCKNPGGSFDDEKFEKASILMSIKEIEALTRDNQKEVLNDIMAGNPEAVLKGDFKHKIDMLEALKSFRAIPLIKSDTRFDFIDKIISEIDSSLNTEKVFLPADSSSVIQFAQKCLGSKGELSEFENILIDSIPLLKEMDEGIPLSFSRDEFLNELNKLCNTKEKKDILSKKAQISLNLEDDKITGYDGIVLLDNFDKNDEFEKSLYDVCNKFFYENKVNSGDKNLDDALNTIIKALPEFINTIGKPQHGTHKYTLDVHHLLVLAYSINNPDYNKLNNTDKTMLKMSALLHDIAKGENKIDKGHQFPSSLYARSIVKKIFHNPEARDRVYELIKNHHWLEEFTNSSDKRGMSRDMAFRFRRPNDFEIAKIMAKADLMAVNDNFYESHKAALEDNNLALIDNNLEYFYSTGCALFTDYFIKKNAPDIKKEIKDNVQYDVIDFHSIKDNEDLGRYGFRSSITKKDAKFLVHMVDSSKIYESLQKLKHLSNSINGGVLSESLITPEYKRTYGKRKYGVLLSQINSNIININDSNQGSGTQKTMDDALSLVFGEIINSARLNFKDGFLKNLGLDKEEISDEDFAEFYRTNVAPKTSLSQFLLNREYKIGNKTFTGRQIREAIEKYQTSLIDKKEQSHNEIVGFAPKIQAVVAFEKSFDNVPFELLKFARENDLPVILM